MVGVNWALRVMLLTSESDIVADLSGAWVMRLVEFKKKTRSLGLDVTIFVCLFKTRCGRLNYLN